MIRDGGGERQLLITHTFCESWAQSLVHPKTCYCPIYVLTLSMGMPHSRLWPQSSLLFSPPETHLSSPLCLRGLSPFRDQIHFTSAALPSRISLCKPTLLPVPPSSPCTHIKLSTSCISSPLNSLFSPCVNPAFLPFQPAWMFMIRYFIHCRSSPYSAPCLPFPPTY